MSTQDSMDIDYVPQYERNKYKDPFEPFDSTPMPPDIDSNGKLIVPEPFDEQKNISRHEKWERENIEFFRFAKFHPHAPIPETFYIPNPNYKHKRRDRKDTKTRRKTSKYMLEPNNFVEPEFIKPNSTAGKDGVKDADLILNIEINEEHNKQLYDMVTNLIDSSDESLHAYESIDDIDPIVTTTIQTAISSSITTSSPSSSTSQTSTCFKLSCLTADSSSSSTVSTSSTPIDQTFCSYTSPELCNVENCRDHAVKSLKPKFPPKATSVPENVSIQAEKTKPTTAIITTTVTSPLATQLKSITQPPTNSTAVVTTPISTSTTSIATGNVSSITTTSISNSTTSTNMVTLKDPMISSTANSLSPQPGTSKSNLQQSQQHQPQQFNQSNYSDYYYPSNYNNSYAPHGYANINNQQSSYQSLYVPQQPIHPAYRYQQQQQSFQQHQYDTRPLQHQHYQQSQGINNSNNFSYYEPMEVNYRSNLKQQLFLDMHNYADQSQHQNISEKELLLKQTSNPIKNNLFPPSFGYFCAESDFDSLSKENKLKHRHNTKYLNPTPAELFEQLQYYLKPNVRFDEITQRYYFDCVTPVTNPGLYPNLHLVKRDDKYFTGIPNDLMYSFMECQFDALDTNGNIKLNYPSEASVAALNNQTEYVASRLITQAYGANSQFLRALNNAANVNWSPLRYVKADKRKGRGKLGHLEFKCYYLGCPLSTTSSISTIVNHLAMCRENQIRAGTHILSTPDGLAVRNLLICKYSRFHHVEREFYRDHLKTCIQNPANIEAFKCQDKKQRNFFLRLASTCPPPLHNFASLPHRTTVEDNFLIGYPKDKYEFLKYKYRIDDDDMKLIEGETDYVPEVHNIPFIIPIDYLKLYSFDANFHKNLKP